MPLTTKAQTHFILAAAVALTFIATPAQAEPAPPPHAYIANHPSADVAHRYINVLQCDRREGRTLRPMEAEGIYISTGDLDALLEAPDFGPLSDYYICIAVEDTIMKGGGRGEVKDHRERETAQ